MTTITHIPNSVGQLMRQFIRLAQTLKSTPMEERQLAIRLAKAETQFITFQLLDAVDHMRIMQGHEPALPNTREQ